MGDAAKSRVFPESRGTGCGGALASFPSPDLPSSVDFEFSIAISPSPEQQHQAAPLYPADELFYKGKLLPLHLIPRLTMVRAILLSSSDATSATAEHRSSRTTSSTENNPSDKKFRHFSPVFLHCGCKKDPTFARNAATFSSSSAKEMIRKYVKKLKITLRGKLFSSCRSHYSQSFSGKRQDSYGLMGASSCPASVWSSPSRSGPFSCDLQPVPASSFSSMDELQSAIQAAISHCKSTLNKAAKDH